LFSVISELVKRVPKTNQVKKGWVVRDVEHNFQTPEGCPMRCIHEVEIKGPISPDNEYFYDTYVRQQREREERWLAWGREARKHAEKQKEESDRLKKFDGKPREEEDPEEHEKWREAEREKDESVFTIGGNKSSASWE
jgi:hypothetical protein